MKQSKDPQPGTHLYMTLIWKTSIFIVLLTMLTIAFPVSSYGFDPYTDIAIDYLPDIEYHPTIVLGEEVIIHNPNSYTSPLLHSASSSLLDNPLGVYVNGVQAHRLHRYDGRGEDGYVEIAIAGNGLDAGFSGYIDEQYLVYPGSGVPVMPVVTLNTQSGVKVALHLDYSEDSSIIAIYPNDTQAQLLGILNDMCHVQIGNHVGFVKTSYLKMPCAVEQGLNDTKPKQFMKLSSIHKHILEILTAYEADLIAQYGKDWPLLQKAEYASISIQLGCQAPFMYGIYIMPGPDDLPQQEAVIIAAQAISDSVGISKEMLLEKFDVYVSFFDATYRHTGHYWRIDFSDPSGTVKFYTSTYISSPSGEVVDFSQER